MLDSHIRFCERYFETLNGSESAIYAGFSPDTARQQAWQILQREDVQSFLQKIRLDYQQKTGITREKVLGEIAKLAFSDIRNYYTEDDKLKAICDLDDNEAAALSSLKTYEEKIPGTDVVIGLNKEIKLYNKLDGLEKLARHLGLYEKDNNQSAVSISVPEIKVYNVGPALAASEEEVKE